MKIRNEVNSEKSAIMPSYLALTCHLKHGTGFAFSQIIDTASSIAADIESEERTYLGYMTVNMQRIRCNT